MIDIEPWLDKYALAEHYSCSYRAIETAKAQGMPHAIIMGKLKFRVSEVDPWLERHNQLVLRGDREEAA